MHVGIEWSHGMSHDNTRHIDMTKRGGSQLGVDRRGHQSSEEGGLWYPSLLCRHDMAYDNTRHTYVAKRGWFLAWGLPTRMSVF